MAPIRLPSKSDRTAIVGRTGSGKTVAAVWHLSKQDIDKRPWFVIDYKGDDLINNIEKATYIDLKAEPTRIKQAGIYILRLIPGEEEKLDQFLWKIWARENCGLYTDEGYMIPAKSQPFNSLLTQGRSKNVSMITLSQRPVWMSRFVFSEASFFQVFDLSHDKDRDKVMEYVKGDITPQLPDYHSYYYDVGKKALAHFAPVPDGDKILADIHEKLPLKRRMI